MNDTPLPSNEPVTQKQLVEKFRRGERLTNSDTQYSMFDAVDIEAAKLCGHHHEWRCIVCWDSEADINECSKCGTQVESACHFDEDFS
jgi:hypothetical protein